MASADEFFHQLNLSKTSETPKTKQTNDEATPAHKNPMTRYAHQALLNSRKRRNEKADPHCSTYAGKILRLKRKGAGAKLENELIGSSCAKKKSPSSNAVADSELSKTNHLDDQTLTDFTCELCGFFTTTKSDYKDHMESIKHLVKVEVEKGTDHTLLSRENDWKTTVQLPYKCSVNSCSAQFIDWRGTLRHIREHNNSFPFSCTKCDSKFRDKGDLASHIKRHLGVKKIRCELCDKLFEKNKDLVSHKVKIHGQDDPRPRNFKCTECGDAFLSKKGVDRHMRSHTGYRPEVCQVCGATFHTAYDLKDHVRIHSGEKPFTCEVCNFSTRTAQLLKRHKKKHEADTPFSCKECSFTCNNAGSLKRHSYIHSGKKRFKCPYCKHRCNDFENLRKHVKKNKAHKGFNVYPCTRCNFFSTDVASDFLQHMKQCHFPHLDLKSTTAAKLSGILIEENPVDDTEDDLPHLPGNSIFENDSESLLRDTDLPPDSIGLTGIHPTPNQLPELGLEALTDLRKLDTQTLNSVNRYDKGDFLLSSAASQETQAPQRHVTFSAPFDEESFVRPFDDGAQNFSASGAQGRLPPSHAGAVKAQTTDSPSPIDINQGYVAVLMKWPSDQKVEVQQGPAEGVTPLTLIVNSNPVYLRTADSKTSNHVGDKACSVKEGNNSSTTYIMSPNGLVLAENEQATSANTASKTLNGRREVIATREECEV